MPSKIEISHRTIIFTVLFLLLLWFIFEIRDILYLLFISFIVMSALRPMVDTFERYKIPRAISILAVYLVVFGLIGYAVTAFIPVVSVQSAKFMTVLPRIEEFISPYVQLDIQSLISQFAPIGQNLVMVSLGVFTNIVTTLTVLVFTFYLLLERQNIENTIGRVLPRDTSKKVIRTIEAVEFGLGSWLRGELILMLFVGFLTYLGLTFLKIDFALPLSIIAGILEIIPVIGPILSAIPAVLVASTVAPFLALATAALFFIIQQVENHIIVPIVMNKAVGLSPLIVIISLMIGARLAGTVGAILAIPVVVMIRAVLRATLSARAD